MTTNLIEDLDEIRVDAEIAEAMIRSVAGELGDDEIATRLNESGDFLLGGIRLAQDIILTTTLAETMSLDAPFTKAVSGRIFSGGDDDLQTVGLALMDKITGRPRMPCGEEIPADVLQSRYKAIRAAL